jgi:hypothetical protein
MEGWTMRGWLTKIFLHGKSRDASTTVRRFTVSDATIDRNLVVDGDAWLIESDESRTVRLFELVDPAPDNCLVFYRASMMAESLSGRAFLEMWCRLPGRGEFFSKGIHQPLRGAAGWSSFEVPFRLRKGQRPDLIKLNVVVEGAGRVWIKDVELLLVAK